MKTYKPEQIRNVGLFSHGGAGKTSLTEALLFATHMVNRLGRVEEGTTVSDFDPDEIKRHTSVNTSVAPCEWQNLKLNLIDAPGLADFVGETRAAARIVDCALLLLDASGGVEVGTDIVWHYAEHRHVPRLLFINKLDRENANFFATLEAARNAFGNKVMPAQLPFGKDSAFEGVIDLLSRRAYRYSSSRNGGFTETSLTDSMQAQVEQYRSQLVECIVESDDDLMNRYLEGETLDEAELQLALQKSVASLSLYPVLCGSATANIGITQLLNFLTLTLPDPVHAPAEEGVTYDPAAPLIALVFKTSADPYVGKQTFFKVYNGVMRSDTTIYNATRGASERIGQLYVVRGKEHLPVTEIDAGDIGMVAKLQITQTGDTLSSSTTPLRLTGIDFPAPLFRSAIKAKTKSDLEKLGTALHRLVEEDPTITVQRDLATGETIISGMGESHVQIAAEKLGRKFGVNVTLELPRVPYRETVTGSSKAEYKHKKQTGGHGQYGHVLLEVMHVADTEFQFTDSVVGGVVPKNYIPAVEKGIREALIEGPLAGFPVINVRVNLYDGSYHPVDSSEMAFKIAAQQAFRKGALEAHPVLLEPVSHLKVTVPDNCVGDVMGNLTSSCRGKVLGMDQVGEGFTLIEAQAPLAEVQRYATDLRALTQGRGIFSMEISHYEVCPPNIAEHIISAHKHEVELAHHH